MYQIRLAIINILIFSTSCFGKIELGSISTIISNLFLKKKLI